MSGVLEVLGWSLLHSVWQGVLVAVALWVVLRLTPGTAVRIRYVATLVALAVLLAIPVLNYSQTMALWNGHRTWVLSTADGILRSELASRGRAEVGAVRAELRRRQAREWPGAAPIGGAPGREAARVFGLLWALSAGLLALRLAGEQRRALRLAETGSPDDGWRRSVAAVAERLGLARPVRVRVSGEVDVPALVGWRWPVVLVPRSAAGLPEEERDAIIAHELAHVGRGDYLANLVQAAAEAVLFYSPAAWWVSARIREERECCCDQTAVRAVRGGAVRYIRALLSLETGRATPRAALALHGGPLLRRIRRLHSDARGQSRPGPAAALAPLVLAAGVVLSVMAATPDVAARRSAGALMAGDIEAVRLVVVRSPAPAPAPASTSVAPMCSGVVVGVRA